MNRRFFVQLFTIGNLLPTGGNKKDKHEVSVVLRCRSLKYPDKIYPSIDTFWADHTDLAAKQASSFFNNFGSRHCFTKKPAKLLKDGKSVELRIVFKNKVYKYLYTLAYRDALKGSPNNSDLYYYYAHFS